MTHFFTDVRAVATRNLIRAKRNPEVMVFGVMQPIMFVLLFSKVFGGAINVQGTDYTNYLMAGIFGQTMIFGATWMGMNIAQDKQRGIIQRFKTLPMSSTAVLFGRTLADMSISVVSLIVMVIAGLLAGWRPNAPVTSILAGMALLLIVTWCFSWVLVAAGLAVRTPEAVNSASFIILMPLTFLSNSFVPTETMTPALRTFAEWNPVSTLVQSVRELFGNTGSTSTPDTWPMQHATLATLLCCVVMLIIFVPLSVRMLRRID